MKQFILKRKASAPPYIKDVEIIDDMITGLIANHFYIAIVPKASELGLLFHVVEYLADFYQWPIKNGIPQTRIENFLRGHNSNLAATIEHYEDVSITIDEVKSDQ